MMNTKDDMVFSIMGFNPMAKSHITDKISELENIMKSKPLQRIKDGFS